MQYPSNWIPSPRQESELVGPIDFIVNYQDQENRFVMLNIFQPAGRSLFTNSKDLAETSITSLFSSPGVNLAKQVECRNFTFNSFPACDYITLSSDPSIGLNLKVLSLGTVDPNGTEYYAQYLATPDLFDHFVPTVKYMIESFRTTNQTLP